MGRERSVCEKILGRKIGVKNNYSKSKNGEKIVTRERIVGRIGV